MKNYRVSFVFLFVACFSLAACGSQVDSSNSSEEETSTSSSFEEDLIFSLNDKRLQQFLTTADPEAELNFINQYGGKRLDKQYWSFNPTKGLSGEYQFYYDTDPNFSSPMYYFPKYGDFQLATPGETYYYRLYKLEGNDERRPTKSFEEAFPFPEYAPIKEGTFTTIDEKVRYLNIQKVGNFRDLGGWETEDKTTVSYEKIYRSPNLDSLTNFAATQIHDLLGIKTEIDLRADTTIDESKFGGVFVNAPILSYDNVFNNKMSLDSFNTIFSLLANEESYPVVFHCRVGADRTGTLAFLISGLLGVGLESLTKDFELTSFSEYGTRGRGELTSPYSYGKFQDDEYNYVNWGATIDGVRQFGNANDSLQKCIENFLMQKCNITDTQINEIRRIMLEK